MIFFFGFSEEKRDLGVDQTMSCPECGEQGSLQAVMTCSVLSVFFIPCFRWNRQYYVRFDCCGSIFQLDRQAGRRLEWDRDVQIQKSDLTLLQTGTGNRNLKKCRNCGYVSEEDEYRYCPKCGERLS